MYAVVESGGKQYRVEEGTVLVVDRLKAEQGDKVTLRPVMVSGDDFVTDAKDLDKIKIEATVQEHLRGDKIKVFKYKAKKGYSRRAGHRAELTKLEDHFARRRLEEGRSEEGRRQEGRAEGRDRRCDQGSSGREGTGEEAGRQEARCREEAGGQEACCREEAGSEKKPAAAKKPAAKKPAAKKPAAKKEDDN